MKKEKKKVMVFGCFDPLHKGHINFFEQAKKEGMKESNKQGEHKKSFKVSLKTGKAKQEEQIKLIISIARDETINKRKERPYYEKEEIRLKKIKKLGIADEVILGDKKDYLKPIEKIKPDIICLGYDQKVIGGKEKLIKNLKARNLTTNIKIMKAYKTEKYKSRYLR